MSGGLESALFDNIDDLDLSLTVNSANEEWLDLMRSEFEDNVLQQVLKPESASSTASLSMRRCDSVPAHIQFMEQKQPKVEPSKLSSVGSQRNLASMCSELTITPTGSVPDLTEYEKRAAAERESGLRMERLILHGNTGAFSPVARSREDALIRYKKKRANRCFRKKIRYECRRKIASDRPRVGGRFARTEDDMVDIEDVNKYVNLEDIPSL